MMFPQLEYHLGPGRDGGELKAPGKGVSNSLRLRNTSVFNGSFTTQIIVIMS